MLQLDLLLRHLAHPISEWSLSTWVLRLTLAIKSRAFTTMCYKTRYDVGGPEMSIAIEFPLTNLVGISHHVLLLFVAQRNIDGLSLGIDCSTIGVQRRARMNTYTGRRHSGWLFRLINLHSVPNCRSDATWAMAPPIVTPIGTPFPPCAPDANCLPTSIN